MTSSRSWILLRPKPRPRRSASLLPLALASPSPHPHLHPHLHPALLIPPSSRSYTLTLGTLVPQVMVAVAKGLNAPVKIMFPKVRP